jgi:hypothetical protein
MTKLVSPSVEATLLADVVTRFVNSAFRRRLGVGFGPSRSLEDAVQLAFDHGYSEEQIRMAFWAARCIPGTWIGEQLGKSIQPEIVLRHKGGMNTITGKPAVRWLDDLVERVGEINPRVAAAVWRSLPKEMQASEVLLLASVEIDVGREA